MTAKWGEFQSIIQISIGLNAAYFSISQFVHHDVAGERSRLAQAAQYADKHLESYKAIRNSLRDLDQAIVAQIEADKNALFLLRIISVVFFFAGLILLWLTSIWAGDDLTNGLVYYGAPFLNAPFVLGILYMLVLAAPSYSGFSFQRETIEKDMREKAAEVPAPDRLPPPVAAPETPQVAALNDEVIAPPPAPDEVTDELAKEVGKQPVSKT